MTDSAASQPSPPSPQSPPQSPPAQPSQSQPPQPQPSLVRHSSPAVAHPRPSTPAQRMLVPDAARGLALLGIAIANIATAWMALDSSSNLPAAYFGGVVDNSPLDKAAVMFSAIAAESRGLPMFSTLLGFGVGLIALSLRRRGFPLPQARRVIARRYAFLAVFGAVHCVFLFFGDIMFFYGICGICFLMLLTPSIKTLRRLATVPLIVTAVFSVLIAAITPWLSSLPSPDAASSHGPAIPGSTLTQTYLDTIVDNATILGFSLVSLVVFLWLYLPIMIVGYTWAMTGVLADVDRHRKVLLRWLGAALVVALGVGVPWGLASLGVLPNQWDTAFAVLNTGLGVLTGPGILAGLALLLNPVQKRINQGGAVPWWLAAFVALGKRSMSGYLMQSILFFALVYPYTLGIPRGMGAATQMGIAVAVWGVTLLGAWALEKAGKQGPFERLHRRLSYGPTLRPELKPAPAAEG